MRWLAVAVFILSSAINFLDRSVLAAVAPLMETEFRKSDTELGFLVSAFSLAYALGAPATGFLLDRYGTDRTTRVLVAFWSGVSILTGMTQNWGQLMLCRVGLGAAESGGVTAVAKMGAQYLPPEERALGSAFGQVGITMGTALAPIVGVGLALRDGWRRPFLVIGLVGLLWIPLWWWVSRKVQPRKKPAQALSRPVIDRRLGILFVANILWMTTYSLWTNWTTIYLVRVQHLSLAGTARLAWIPPIASNLGALFGGWLALRWIVRGLEPVRARMRILLISALGGLVTLALPLAPDLVWATAAICVSFFFCLAGSVNIYTLPIDWYGAERAGLATSALVLAYGVLQTGISPLIGKLLSRGGLNQICWLVAIPPVAAWALLRFSQAKKPTPAE